tara:strand:+ start:8848 stop:9600 length:753 start_codon:yes stop_codon:yes gene_type:complete
MIAYIKIFIIILFFNNSNLYSRDIAQTYNDELRTLSIFQPKTYYPNNRLELSTHPILFLIIPNLNIKKYHGKFYNIYFASRYSFLYPSNLLRLIQKDGIGGILSNDPNINIINNMYVLKNEGLLSKIFTKSSLTGKLGFSICYSCNLDDRNIIDYPIIYPRMLLYKHGFSANSGLDWDYSFSENIQLKFDIDLIIVPDNQIFFEHKSIVNYQFNKKHTLNLGYKVTHGNYQFGRRWDLFPLIDLSYQWNK